MRSAPVSNRKSAVPLLIRTVTIGMLPNSVTANSAFCSGRQLLRLRCFPGGKSSQNHQQQDKGPVAFVHRTGLSRTRTPLILGDDANPLNFHKQLGAREPGNGDQCTRRKVIAQDFLAQLGEAIAIARIGDEDGHRHHIGNATADLGQSLTQAGEHLPHLTVEIAGE